jgi:uncharacterized protein (DUF1697 family)
MPRYVAFLRAISNVGMEPFREKLEALGFSDVESYGMSGNFLFSAGRSAASTLEQRLTTALGATALVRTAAELERIVADDPHGSSILLLARAPSAARRLAFDRLEFESEHRPVLLDRTVYFVYPARIRGTQSPLDFERTLGVTGTARSAAVVNALLERLEG